MLLRERTNVSSFFFTARSADMGDYKPKYYMDNLAEQFVNKFLGYSGAELAQKFEAFVMMQPAKEVKLNNTQIRAELRKLVRDQIRDTLRKLATTMS